jgi:hypothetical protein
MKIDKNYIFNVHLAPEDLFDGQVWVEFKSTEYRGREYYLWIERDPSGEWRYVNQPMLGTLLYSEVDEEGRDKVDIDDHQLSKPELDRLLVFLVNHPKVRLLLLYK